MSRTCLVLAVILIVECLSITTAQSGERRNRPARSQQPANAAPAYGPVQRTNGLPYGRAYYGGRYFGNFNNRFYGPQYGYF